MFIFKSKEFRSEFIQKVRRLETVKKDNVQISQVMIYLYKTFFRCKISIWNVLSKTTPPKASKQLCWEEIDMFAVSVVPVSPMTPMYAEAALMYV